MKPSYLIFYLILLISTKELIAAESFLVNSETENPIEKNYRNSRKAKKSLKVRDESLYIDIKLKFHEMDDSSVYKINCIINNVKDAKKINNDKFFKPIKFLNDLEDYHSELLKLKYLMGMLMELHKKSNVDSKNHYSIKEKLDSIIISEDSLYKLLLDTIKMGFIEPFIEKASGDYQLETLNNTPNNLNSGSNFRTHLAEYAKVHINNTNKSFNILIKYLNEVNKTNNNYKFKLNESMNNIVKEFINNQIELIQQQEIHEFNKLKYEAYQQLMICENKFNKLTTIRFKKQKNIETKT